MMKKILDNNFIPRNAFNQAHEEPDPSACRAGSHTQDDNNNDKRLRVVGGIFVLAFAALYLTLSGCSMPAAPTHSNPLDPDNPDFTGPGVEIISPVEGASIASGMATIHLHGSGPGYEYSYKLDTAQAWHEPWSNDTILTLTNLKEGSHSIQAIARDKGGYLGLPTPVRNFIINQYANTVLMYPPNQTVAVGETAEVWCEMEDMATPVSAINLVFYIGGYLVADTISAQADTGYHWISNGGSPMGPFFTDYNNWSSPNYMEVSLGVAGGTPAGITGTGRIFKIKAEAIQTGTMSMRIYNLSARDTLNNPVTVTNPSNYAYIYVTSSKEGGK